MLFVLACQKICRLECRNKVEQDAMDILLGQLFFTIKSKTLIAVYSGLIDYLMEKKKINVCRLRRYSEIRLFWLLWPLSP